MRNFSLKMQSSLILFKVTLDLFVGLNLRVCYFLNDMTLLLRDYLLVFFPGLATPRFNQQLAELIVTRGHGSKPTAGYLFGDENITHPYCVFSFLKRLELSVHQGTCAG